MSVTHSLDESWTLRADSHGKAINVGRGRVVWGYECIDASGRRHSEGWVLPGGARTQDRAKAQAAATRMDQATGRRKNSVISPALIASLMQCIGEEGLTQREAASRHGVSPASVNRAIARGIRKAAP